MAKCVDNYSDLKELGIDCEEGDDSLTEAFERAASHLQSLLPNVERESLLILYGYYKQGSEGACNTPKPSWYDIKAKAKWEAWRKLGNMPSREAKSFYVNAIKELDPTFDELASREQWVKVSSMQDGEYVPECEKMLVDYIKEGSTIDVKDYLDKNASSKASVNRTDKDGLAPIHWAADSGYYEIIGILISCGADVNLQDAEGQTALHYAASCGHVECVKFLLQNGGRGDIVDGESNTPLSVASDDSVKELFSNELL